MSKIALFYTEKQLKFFSKNQNGFGCFGRGVLSVPCWKTYDMSKNATVKTAASSLEVPVSFSETKGTWSDDAAVFTVAFLLIS